MQSLDGNKLERQLNELDRKLNQLKVSYEQYFIGIEKLEPVNLRQEVAKLVNDLSKAVIQNTGHKFKLSSLTSKYNSFQTYWNRNLKEIEEGTSRRDRFRQRMIAREQTPTPGTSPIASSPKKEAKTGQTGSAVDKLFEQYVAARKKTNEPVDNIKRERLEETIKKQAAAIKQRYGVKKVSFKVVIESGKTKIKAVPKKDD